MHPVLQMSRIRLVCENVLLETNRTTVDGPGESSDGANCKEL
jgi:hypothetical protein